MVGAAQGEDRSSMLLVVLVVVSAAALYWITVRRPNPLGRTPPKLGWMSEQWLNEYRASHPS
jgi:hypothetical protein